MNTETLKETHVKITYLHGYNLCDLDLYIYDELVYFGII